MNACCSSKNAESRFKVRVEGKRLVTMATTQRMKGKRKKGGDG
jgi:hypothetical protein